MTAIPPNPSLDWSQRISLKGDQVVIRSCGLSVQDCLTTLARYGEAEMLRRHPDLAAEDVQACLLLAAEVIPSQGEALRSRLAVEELPTLPPPPPDEMATLAPVNLDEEATLAPHEPLPPVRGRPTIPGYEILGELGRGGMGVVYKARQVRLNRIVALKMILAGEHASDEIRERFQIEAEAVARLQHPGIVQIYEVGEHQGHSFLALEYVDGGSLASQLTGQPWEAQQAAVLVEKLARAIQAAHARGIVHRDLKPENVLLTTEGDPKITDFGLAKNLETEGKTQTGAVMGTPSYMAPEQAAGQKDIGPAADVWALGGILYRLLTGRPPFEGPTTLDILLKVMEDEAVPPCEHQPHTPRDLETITLKCLQKKAPHRYLTALEVADDLRRFLEEEPILARKPSTFTRVWRETRKRPASRAMSVVMLIMLVLMGAFGSSGLLLVGVWVVFALLMIPGLQTPARKLLVGSGIAVALVWPAALVVLHPDVSAYLNPQLGGEGPSDRLALTLALLPGLLGLLAGALKWRYGLIPLAVLLLVLVAWRIGFGWLSPTLMMTVVALVALYFATVVRIVYRRYGGDLLEATSGALLGYIVGAGLGALALGCVGLIIGPVNQWLPADVIPVLTMMGIALFVLAGTIFGAIRGTTLMLPKRRGISLP